MMKNKIYSSFEEIDKDLKILRLEKEIDRLNLTSQVSHSVEQLSFKNLFSHTWLSFLFNEKRWMHIAIEYALFFLFKRRKL